LTKNCQKALPASAWAKVLSRSARAFLIFPTLQESAR
jgi:hypothetical protein